MQASGRGDSAAFARLFDRHQASVVRFCYRFVGTQARAEELAQDIFIKVYRSSAGYRPTAAFKTYLFRIATNHCLNDVRRGAVVTEAEMTRDDTESPLEREPSSETPEDALRGRELEGAVSKALSTMSDRERAAFAMCRFEGMAYRDIAHALEATEAAVKSLIHRATLQVMKQLEALDEGVSPTGRSVA
ncbi:MAG: RNA polymerase sigma factor [Archangium sp.]|nr:RNA polymerase sigma factor [Archangium sp.]